jgi:S1-C subfamily serine protease
MYLALIRSCRQPLHLLRVSALAFAAALAGLLAAPLHAQTRSPDGPPELSELTAIVHVHARIVPDARSAETLGTSRSGTGVVIDTDGLVLTIGYLVMEAAAIDITGADGRTLPATLVAYDPITGFGLVRPLLKLAAKPLPFGDSSALAVTDSALIATPNGYSLAQVVSRRNFAGYWEYLLENAIFTAPARPDFGGAALISKDGKLLGIGSLYVADAAQPGTRSPGNMFVPVDALKPVLKDLVAKGRSGGAARPWLGFNLALVDSRIFVTRVSKLGPAEQAGVQPGDVIEAVGDQAVTSLEHVYRAIWERGNAGINVPLRVARDEKSFRVDVRSIDRSEYLRKQPTY